MPVVINGTTGISGVDGTAATPAIEGSDTNTGMFFPAADTIAFAEGGAEVMRLDSSGNLVIGNTTALAKLDVGAVGGADEGGEIRIRGSSSGTRDYYVDVFQSDMRFVAVDKGTASTNASVRLSIDSSGNVLVTGPGVLGYGAGSGGTVTQATSKTTAVTLNKYTGRITMNNAALAAGANVSFTVNNSLVAVGDIVSITHSSGGTIGNYFARIYGVGSGSFVVNIINISAGSLSDALVLSFAVTRSATS